MKRLHYHPDSYYNSDTSTWHCSQCHVETRNGMSEFPCNILTAAQSVLGDYKFEISVWNLSARVICFKEDKGKRHYFKIKTTEEIKNHVKKLAEDSVYQAGGVISFSGIYPLSEELERFLEEKIKNGEITLKQKE